MDKKVICIIAITIIFLAVVIYLVLTIMNVTTPKVDQILEKLNDVAGNWFNLTLSP